MIETFDFPAQLSQLRFGFLSTGYLEQAEVWFQRAQRDDPSSAEALYGLGSVYLKQEKTAKRAKASSGRPNSGQLSRHAGQCMEQPRPAGDSGRAHWRCDSVFPGGLKINPDHLIALENLGNAYRQQKNWEEARKTLERAVAVGPQDPEANYSLGMVFAQLNDTDRAYEYLQRALQARPGYPEALNNLGVLYLRTGRRDEAVASFEECIRVAPAFDQSYLNLARVYALEGTPDKARSVLLELLKQRPGHAQAQKALEQLQNDKRACSKSARQLKLTLTASPLLRQFRLSE